MFGFALDKRETFAPACRAMIANIITNFSGALSSANLTPTPLQIAELLVLLENSTEHHFNTVFFIFWVAVAHFKLTGIQMEN